MSLIPSDAKKIGILVSGGIDSSLLLYLLCKEIADNNLPMSIYAFSMKVPNRFQKNITQNIINYISEKTHVTVTYNSQMRKYLIRNGVKTILDVYSLDYVFTGCNKVVYDEFTPTRIIRDDTPPVRGEPLNSSHLRPFINLDKREIIGLYVQENITDLLPLTISCGIAETHPPEIQECLECYFCMEKRWALDFYGL